MANGPNDNSPTTVADQILSSADFYSPSIYQTLNFFSSYRPTPDSVATEFIPVTGVKLNSANGKIFVVGIIPPATNITGRLLDRSASIAGLTGDPQTVDLSGGTFAGGSNRGNTTDVPTGPKTTTDPDFWKQYVCMCNRMGVQPEELAQVINNESGFNPAAQNFAAGKDQPAVAKGLNQLIHPMATKMGMSEDEWANYQNESSTEQLKWVERYFRGSIQGKTSGGIYAVNFGGYNNPNGSLYDKDASAKGYVNGGYQAVAYEQNKQLDKDHKGYITIDDLANSLHPLPSGVRDSIAGARAALGMSSTYNVNDPLASEIAADTSSSWNGTGSANAQASSVGTAKGSNTGLNTTELGKRFLLAQLATIRATQLEVAKMQKMPPLRLLVNPTSFKISSEKIVSDGNWTRNGPIVEHWGDNQDKIEASGKVAAFQAIDALNATGPGLTRTARQYSASYQNLLSLYLLYRNNANLYLSGDKVTGDKFFTRMSMVGSIYIYYDDILYFGSFDSFSMTEGDTNPFSLDYSFQFTVRAAFTLDRPDSLNTSPVNNNPSLLPNNTNSIR